MSNGRKLKLVAAVDPATGPAPTITRYQEIAGNLTVAVKEAFTLIGSFEAPHRATVKFVRGHQSVPNDFIRTVASSVDDTPELQSVKKLDVNEARDTLQFIDAFMPVVDLLNALGRDLKFTIDSRKAKVAADALQIYEIAKGVARDPGSANVASHVANMKRDLNRRRAKQRTTANAPTEETATDAGTTP
jgi:hypothetical protein